MDRLKISGIALTVAAAMAVSATVVAIPAAAPTKSLAFANPARAGARLPRLVKLPGSGVLMSWIEYSSESSTLKFSVLRHGQWGPVGEVARGAHWFLNWADFPSVVAIDDHFWIAHWQVGHPGGQSYDYDIALAVSNDAGATWRSPRTPHRDGSATEHGFVSIFPLGAAAGLIWLDGRDDRQPSGTGEHADKKGTFSLRFAPIERDGSIGPETIVDPDVCTCCQTAAVATSNGVVAAWRGHGGDDIRDNLVARLVGGAWATAQPLGAEGWLLNACPTNGPALSARGQDVVAAWFSGEGGRPRVRVAFSTDSGAHFGAATEIDAAGPIGRVGASWIDSGNAVISWIAHPKGDLRTAPLVLRTMQGSGAIGPVETVAMVSAGRDSGVPQIAADAGCLLVAWTGKAPTYGIQTARRLGNGTCESRSTLSILARMRVIP